MDNFSTVRTTSTILRVLITPSGSKYNIVPQKFKTSLTRAITMNAIKSSRSPLEDKNLALFLNFSRTLAANFPIYSIM